MAAVFCSMASWHRSVITGIRASVPLPGPPRTLGEAIHIASDDVFTWNQIADALAAAWTQWTV
jgi:hypothetical protein